MNRITRVSGVVALAFILGGLTAVSLPAVAALVEPGAEIDLASGGARPSVAVAADGQGAVLWVEISHEGGIVSTVLELQRFTEDGALDGDPLEVISTHDQSGVGSDFSGLASGRDGSFLVAWWNEDLRVRRVAPGGALGNEMVIAPGSEQPYGFTRPAVAADPRGGYVIAWREPGLGHRILLRHLGADGAPSGPARVVVTADEHTGLEAPSLSVGPAGGAVVVWPASVQRDHTIYDEVHGRWYSPSGEPVGPPTGLAVESSDEKPAVTHLSTGEVLTAWQGRNGATSPFPFVLRRYDSAGRLLAETTLDPADTPAPSDAPLQLAPIVGGGAFLAYLVDYRNDPRLLGQVLDPSLAPAGEPVQINRFDFGGAGIPRISSDGGSRILAAWQAGELSFEVDVYSRALQVAAAGALSFAEPTTRVGEGQGRARIAVRRVGFGEGAASVEYQSVGDTADAGTDYLAVEGTLHWPDGDLTERTIELPVLQDQGLEAPEVVRLLLSDPGGGAVLGEIHEAQVVIEDDDRPAMPGDTPVPLTAEEVACDRDRLSGLLDRLVLLTPNGTKTAGINLSLTVTGDFAGIAYTGNGPITAEHHLAFSTDPEVTTLLLNPERPQLPAVAMARNPVNSDLVAADDRDLLAVRIRPTLDSGTPPEDAFLVVDNLAGSAGRASQVKPGRGLSGLLTACHRNRLVARDAHVVRVLSKIARLEVAGAARTQVAIHRAPQIDTYALEARAFDGAGRLLGIVAAEVSVTYATDGGLQTGTLRLEPPCSGNGAACTSLDRPGTLLLVHPTFTGQLWAPTQYRVELPAAPAGESVAVDWTDLLAGTTWRQPR